MQGGKTIAQVATDRGVAVDKVITAMVDDMKAKVAAALTAGTITQAKAEEELADEPKETTDKVNNVNKGRGGKPTSRSWPPGSSPTPTTTPPSFTIFAPKPPSLLR